MKISDLFYFFFPSPGLFVLFKANKEATMRAAGCCLTQSSAEAGKRGGEAGESQSALRVTQMPSDADVS